MKPQSNQFYRSFNVFLFFIRFPDWFGFEFMFFWFCLKESRVLWKSTISICVEIYSFGKTLRFIENDFSPSCKANNGFEMTWRAKVRVNFDASCEMWWEQLFATNLARIQSVKKSVHRKTKNKTHSKQMKEQKVFQSHAKAITLNENVRHNRCKRYTKPSNGVSYSKRNRAINWSIWLKDEQRNA